MTYADEHPGPGFGQTQIRDWVKPINGVQTFHFLRNESPMEIQIYYTIKMKFALAESKEEAKS